MSFTQLDWLSVGLYFWRRERVEVRLLFVNNNCCLSSHRFFHQDGQFTQLQAIPPELRDIWLFFLLPVGGPVLTLLGLHSGLDTVYLGLARSIWYLSVSEGTSPLIWTPPTHTAFNGPSDSDPQTLWVEENYDATADFQHLNENNFKKSK